MLLELLIRKVYAQNVISIPIAPPNGITDFNQLLACIIKYFTVYIAPSILVIMILYGAFKMLTASGEPEKFALGRKVILYAIVGYLIVLIATGLVAVVQSVLGGGTSAVLSCPISFL